MRAFVRARATGSAPGEVLIAAGAPDWGGEGKRKPSLPNLDAAQALRLHIPPGPEPVVVYGELPKSVGARAGLRAQIRGLRRQHRPAGCACAGAAFGRAAAAAAQALAGRRGRRQRQRSRRVRQMPEDLRHFLGGPKKRPTMPLNAGMVYRSARG